MYKDYLNGYCVDRPLFHRFPAREFQCVMDWIENKEYTPVILDRGTPQQRLDSTAYNMHGMAYRCGLIFTIARHLEIDDLKTLALEKLKLCKPWLSRHILSVARTFLTESTTEGPAETELQNLLEDHIAANFYELARDEPETFRLILAKHALFEYSVLSRRLEIVSEKIEAGVLDEYESSSEEELDDAMHN